MPVTDNFPKSRTRTALAAACIFVTAFFLSEAVRLSRAAPSGSGYRVLKTIPLGGEGFWDYLTIDSAARRLYISRATHVIVIDADTGSVVGDIPDTAGVHGIALAQEFNHGFTSNGRASTVTVFDLRTLKTIGTVKTGEVPDAILFDPASKRVFTFNARGQDATAIDAASAAVLGSIPLGGKPEFGVADGQGHAYVNIEDKSEVVQFDTNKLAVLHRWPLAPCQGPTGLAIDQKNRRLFAGCRNKLMAVVDADSGTLVQTLPIGAGVDGTAFDPERGLAFSSNGEGTLTAIREESPKKFSVVENITTKRGARTMALDAKTHNIYLATANFEPPTPGQEGRPKMTPNSFLILVVGQVGSSSDVSRPPAQ